MTEKNEKDLLENKEISEDKPQKVKKHFIKNEKLRHGIKQSTGLIVGFLLGSFFMGICFTSEITDNESIISEQASKLEQNDTEIAILQGKVDSAKPWFDKKAEEQKKIEEENAKVEAERKAQEEKKAEEERKAKEEQEKNKYNTPVTYDEIARNPENTLLKKCKFSGEVVQVLEGTGKNNLRVAINGDYDKMMLVEYDPSIVSSRILDNDNVVLYGTSAGTTSYTSTMGQKITIPAMLADKIEIN